MIGFALLGMTLQVRFGNEWFFSTEEPNICLSPDQTCIKSHKLGEELGKSSAELYLLQGKDYKDATTLGDWQLQDIEQASKTSRDRQCLQEGYHTSFSRAYHASLSQPKPCKPLNDTKLTCECCDMMDKQYSILIKQLEDELKAVEAHTFRNSHKLKYGENGANSKKEIKHKQPEPAGKQSGKSARHESTSKLAGTSHTKPTTNNTPGSHHDGATQSSSKQARV